MIDDRWVQPKAPVLVVCCVENATVPSTSALNVADQLGLLHLSRPWQVGPSFKFVQVASRNVIYPTLTSLPMLAHTCPSVHSLLRSSSSSAFSTVSLGSSLYGWSLAEVIFCFTLSELSSGFPLLLGAPVSCQLALRLWSWY